MKLAFLAEAQDELRNAYAWYAERNPDAAVRFALEVRRVVDAITGAPGRWPAGRRGFRKMLCTGFPYSVVYRWDQTASIVVVAAVAHQHRRANYWGRR